MASAFVPRRKVIMLMSSIGNGGAARAFFRLGKVLSQHHDLTVVFFSGESHLKRAAIAHLAPQATFVFLDDGNRRRGRVGRWIFRWRKFRALKIEHDAAISFYPGANFLNAIALTGVPTIVSERTSKSYDRGSSPVRHFVWTHILDPLTYRCSDRIVPVSVGLSNEIGAAAPKFTAGKIVSFEGYVDSAMLIAAAEDEVEPELECLSGSPLLVTCGRLHPQKGYQHLIPIFSKVKETVSEAKLLIVGDGTELGNLQEICQMHGLKPTVELNKVASADVIFIGYRENPNRYFRIARLFVLSSLYEGLPNTLIEAMAAGVPLMAADCPWGPRSILSRDPASAIDISIKELPAMLDYGKLMPRIDSADSYDLWASELASALTEKPEKRKTLAQRQRMVGRFDINITGKKWLDLIEKLITSSAAAERFDN